jgi:hypothetical protein
MSWFKNNEEEKRKIEERLWKLENPPKYEVGVVYEIENDGKKRNFVCVGIKYYREGFFGSFLQQWKYTTLNEKGEVVDFFRGFSPITLAKEQTITIKLDK